MREKGAHTALPHCPPSLPSLTALPHCPPSLPSLTALPHCPPSLPSHTALPHCPPSLPSLTALPHSNPSLPHSLQPTILLARYCKSFSRSSSLMISRSLTGSTSPSTCVTFSSSNAPEELPKQKELKMKLFTLQLMLPTSCFSNHHD